MRQFDNAFFQMSGNPTTGPLFWFVRLGGLIELYRAAALEGVNRPMHNRISGFASATLLATTTAVLSLSVAAQQVPQQLQPSADEQLLLQVRTAR